MAFVVIARASMDKPPDREDLCGALNIDGESVRVALPCAEDHTAPLVF